MNKDELIEIVMSLIVEAGQAKTHAMNSIKYSKVFDFENAKEQISKSEFCFTKAHEIQTELIAKDLDGKEIVVDLLTVHSQDHLTMALMAKEMAVEIMDIYMKIKEEMR